MRKKLLVLELNEVPYRVIDAYCDSRPASNLARLLSHSAQFSTYTEDCLALDPWISWPTFHRGVHDATHQILHLGQVLDDNDTQYPPIWRFLKERDVSVGVFGSLHSSAIPPDATSYSFYVPDYFGTDTFAHPSQLEPFQRLNLAMTRQSARNVTRGFPVGDFARFLASAPSSGLTFDTIVDSGSHLVRECFDRSLRIRRRAYQPLVMADLFIKQMERSQPAFATFYTNHVAAAMHRYWGAAFPEDYAKPLDSDWIAQYSGEIQFSMDKLDAILGRLMKFIERHPEYVLMVGSSMGQAAISAEKTFQFLTICDLAKFMEQLGVPAGAWESRPAMVPCHCVVVTGEYRDRVLAAIETLQIGDARFQSAKRPIAPLSFDEREHGFFQFFVQFDSYKGPDRLSFGERTVTFAEAGLGMMAHEDGVNCTAQHVPEGSLFVYSGEAGAKSPNREKVSTLDVAPSIIKFFGYQVPSYMGGSSALLS